MTDHNDETIIDSPTDWVAKHIHRYIESDGKEGHMYYGVPALLLTTRGRKSGKLRRTALYYGQDGARYVVIASNGGSSDHPAWYLNLVDHPEVTLQVGAETFAGLARLATAEERPGLWQLMVTMFPMYNTYQQKAGREIPVVVIEPA